MTILRTGRLEMRPVAPSDHLVLHALFTEPGVRRFIFDDQQIPPEQTAAIIQKSEELFRTERAGLWIARLGHGEPSAPTGAAVGFGAFWYFRDPPERELLYGVSDSYVKQGYGREIASAVIAYGIRELHMRTIRASTDEANSSSRRLLEDLGFVLERRATVGGLETVFYCKVSGT
jgi:[ribosomal protein S5]-alanine N-acetyltransferase